MITLIIIKTSRERDTPFSTFNVINHRELQPGRIYRLRFRSIITTAVNIIFIISLIRRSRRFTVFAPTRFLND